ncbi:MAG: hypothetical protein A3E01_07020 [Gammaproteobacteria bacterium RIFCSPHIGHO2_12_FULL_63_22]|nr:MAG: hypothetical protein A3E01_07020 [Gammaproteobacteria bacterium RIFCSPHIGHO2_12_FULL_63_22]
MPLTDAERAYKREYRLRRIAADPLYSRRLADDAMRSRRKALAERPEEYRATLRENDRRRNATEARKDYTANRGLLKRYGITLADKQAMFDAQLGRCAIEGCGQPFASLPEAYLDHNHETGKVRDLLCSSCNLALGHGRDNAERLRSLAAYLDKHK